ncbi:hypothetical protein SAMN06297422_13012 [Lachnospiraceae bacterium]|nr:hypothetical protein SAMN06297422_13012 [Lachnospiraceae bacterium]
MKKTKRIMAVILSAVLIIQMASSYSLMSYADQETNDKREEPITDIIHENEETTERFTEYVTEETTENEIESGKYKETITEEIVQDGEVSTEQITEEDNSENAETDKSADSTEADLIQKDDTENNSDLKDVEKKEEEKSLSDKADKKTKKKSKADKKEIQPTFDKLYGDVSVDGIDFSSCELLVATKDVGVFTADTEVVSEYNGIYLTRYEDAEQTKSAYTYYFTRADFVEVNSVIRAAEDHGEADLSDINNGDDAISNITSAPASSWPGCVALIDTGAEGSNVVSSISIIGESVADDNGHGSRMLKAMTEANPDVKILSIKALDSNAVGTISDVYAAIEYAVRADVSVINLSMCSVATAESDVLNQAISDAVSKGIIVIASAGNNGRDAGFFVPAGISGVITIGACDANGNRLSTSNYGSAVDYYVVAESTSDAAARFSAYAIRYGLSEVSKNEKVFSAHSIEEKISTKGETDKKDDNKQTETDASETDEHQKDEIQQTEKTTQEENETADKDDKLKIEEKIYKHKACTRDMLNEIFLMASATPPEGSGFPHYISDVTVVIEQTSQSGKSFAGYMVSAEVPKTSRYYNKIKVGGVTCWCSVHDNREGGCADPGPGKHTISKVKFEYVSSSKGVATYTAVSNVDGQAHEYGYQKMELTIKLEQQNSYISIQKVLAGSPKSNAGNVYFDVYDNKNASGSPLGYMKTSSSSGVAHNVYTDKDISTLTHSTSDGLKGSLDLPPDTTVYLFEVGQGDSYSKAKNKAPSGSKYKTDAAHEAGQPNVTKYAIDLLPDDSKYIARYTVKTSSSKGGTEETLTNPIEEFVYIYKKDEYGNELNADYQIYGTTKEVNLSSNDRQTRIDKIKKASGSKLITTLSVKDGFGLADVSSYKRDHLDDDRYYYAVEVEGTVDSTHKVSLPFKAESRTYKPEKGDYGYAVNTDVEGHYYYKVGIYKYDDEGKNVQASFDIYSTPVSGATSGGTLIKSITTSGSTGYGELDITENYIKSCAEGKPNFYYAVETATDDLHEMGSQKETALKIVKGDAPDFKLTSPDYVRKLNPLKKKVRADIELYKVDENGDPISEVQFKLTEKQTGQSVILVTDENGYVSTASSYVAHSQNTNAGTAKSGTWFGDMKELDEKSGALFTGEYVIRELRCTANNGMQLEKEQQITITGEDENKIIKVFDKNTEETDDKIWNINNPVISTTASVVETDSKTLAQQGCDDTIDYKNQTIKDDIKYQGLRSATDYTLLAELMVVDKDGNVRPYTKDEEPLRITSTFKTPEKTTRSVNNTSGTHTLYIKGVDPTGLEERQEKLVVFESLYLGTYNSVEELDKAIEEKSIKTRYDEYSEEDDMDFFPVEHKDENDDYQTVRPGDIHTNAGDGIDSDNVAYPRVSSVIKDKVYYTGLEIGKEYTVKGILRIKTDSGEGEELKGADGQPVVAEKSFKAEASEGYVELEFTFDASVLKGKTVVAFEELFYNGIKIAVHADINDEDESIHFPEVKTTSRNTILSPDKTDDSAKEVEASEKGGSITDTVSYKNLIANKTYIIRGTLINKSTGEILKDATGKEIKGECTFKTPITGEVKIDKSPDAVDYELPDGTVMDLSSDHADYMCNGSADVIFDGYDLSNLAGVTGVVYEEVYLVKKGREYLVGEHKDQEDIDQFIYFVKIKTEANDSATNSKVVPYEAETEIEDTVSYKNVIPGKEYTLTATLHVKNDAGKKYKNGDVLLDKDGKPVTATFSFVPDKKDGTAVVKIPVNTEGLSGMELVVFEEMRNEYGVQVAAHNDIEDSAQTVQVPGGYTSAVEKKSKNKSVEPDEDITIVDTIVYTNLEPGVEYKVKGILYSKESEKPVKIDNKLVTSTVSFTPKEKNGKVEVPFDLNTKEIAGISVVAFEDVTIKNEKDEDVLVFSHRDINSKEQTIKVNESPEEKTKKKNTPQWFSPKTGDDAKIVPIFLIMIGSFISIVIIWRKRKKTIK